MISPVPHSPVVVAPSRTGGVVGVAAPRTDVSLQSAANAVEDLTLGAGGLHYSRIRLGDVWQLGPKLPFVASPGMDTSESMVHFLFCVKNAVNEILLANDPQSGGRAAPHWRRGWEYLLHKLVHKAIQLTAPNFNMICVAVSTMFGQVASLLDDGMPGPSVLEQLLRLLG